MRLRKPAWLAKKSSNFPASVGNAWVKLVLHEVDELSFGGLNQSRGLGLLADPPESPVGRID